MEYLLDTNICIYIIKKKPTEVFEKFKNLTIGDVGISSITLAELQYGIEKSSSPEKNREALEKFLTPIVQLNPSPLQQHHIFHMVRMRKHIYWLNANNFICFVH
ncbi:MAG TPA: hypothetical protein DCR40_04750 [Prolixibacteraceae bacterium]|nr:hypothetical protein [Prolixibacteraceae bacterium]